MTSMPKLKEHHHYVVYLASHNRPVHEVLFPALRDIRKEYENNFQGMTEEPVELEALLAARDRMVRELHQGLSAAERCFLLSLVAAEPEWSLLSVEHLEQLPGPRWKVQNLKQLRNANPKNSADSQMHSNGRWPESALVGPSVRRLSGLLIRHALG
jgi:hypothetical protein